MTFYPQHKKRSDTVEEVTVKLVPRNTNNPTLTENTTNASHTFVGVVHDTYDYEITSTAYDTVTGILVVDSEKTVNITLSELEKEIVITWIPKSRTRSVAFKTTTKYDNNLLPSEGFTTGGTNGVETQTYELKHIDGKPTSDERNVSGWVVTKQPIDSVITIGTKEEEMPVVPVGSNILTPSNVRMSGSTDLQVNGVKADPQTVADLSKVELRQWATPHGGVNIMAGDLSTNKDYTLAFRYEAKTSNVEKIRSTGNLAFWNHKAYLDGDLVSERSDAEVTEDKYIAQGQHTFVYQFKVGDVSNLSQNMFQFIFNQDVAGISSSNAAILWLSDVGIYEGHVDPFV